MRTSSELARVPHVRSSNSARLRSWSSEAFAAAAKKPITALLFLVVLLAEPVSSSRAEDPSIPSGAVDGHVVCDDGSPARLATVFLLPLARYLPKEQQGLVPPAPDPSYTDLDGYYLFTGVPPGVYVVDIHKDGYSRTLQLVLHNSDQFSPTQLREALSAFPQVTVKAGGTSRQDAVIHRGAAISGRIGFDTGGVLSSAGEVTATLLTSKLFHHQTITGGNSQHPGIAFSDTVTPDDRGVYRLDGLPAGEYRIDVRVTEPGNTIPNIRVRGLADLKVFAPDSLTEAGEKLVAVDEGDDVSGVDLMIPIGKLHSVSGLVIQHGVPVPSVKVSLRPSQEQWEPHHWYAGSITTAEGVFRFDLVPSGVYKLDVEDDRKDAGPNRFTRPAAITVNVIDTDVTEANIDLSSTAGKEQH